MDAVTLAFGIIIISRRTITPNRIHRVLIIIHRNETEGIRRILPHPNTFLACRNHPKDLEIPIIGGNHPPTTAGPGSVRRRIRTDL